MSQLRLHWASPGRDLLPCYIPVDVKRHASRILITRLYDKDLITFRSGTSHYIYYDEKEFLVVHRSFTLNGSKTRATKLVKDSLAGRKHAYVREELRTPRPHPSSPRRKLTIEIYGDEVELQETWDRIRSTLVLRGGPVVFVGHKIGGVS